MSCHSPFKNSERMCAVIISREFAQYVCLAVLLTVMQVAMLAYFLLIARSLDCRRNASERRGDGQRLIQHVG